MKDLVHFGNNNFKRKTTSCGLPATSGESTRINEVNCPDCIRAVLNRQAKLGFENSKTPFWIDRLKELTGETINFQDNIDDTHSKIECTTHVFKVPKTGLHIVMGKEVMLEYGKTYTIDQINELIRKQGEPNGR